MVIKGEGKCNGCGNSGMYLEFLEEVITGKYQNFH